jgi:hypothetical protein
MNRQAGSRLWRVLNMQLHRGRTPSPSLGSSSALSAVFPSSVPLKQLTERGLENWDPGFSSTELKATNGFKGEETGHQPALWLPSFPRALLCNVIVF